MDVKYAYQELTNLPYGYEIPNGRIKPFGTAHAVLSAKNIINGPFAVINADDFYGASAFKVMYEYLKNTPDSENIYEYAMVGYSLENTVTDNGYVSRGICNTNNSDYLVDITERTRIETHQNGIHFTEDDAITWHDIAPNTTVSMNMWGFNTSFLQELEDRFIDFLNVQVKQNPLKSEYFLPSVVDALIKENKAQVKVLKSSDKWFGITYKEDKQAVVNAINNKTSSGLYPENLWD